MIWALLVLLVPFFSAFFLALLVLEMSQIGAPFPLFWWHTVKIDSQWCNRLMEERTFLNHFLYWMGLAAVLGWHLPRAVSPLWAADGTSLSITWWDKFHSVGLISDQWYFFFFSSVNPALINECMVFLFFFPIIRDLRASIRFHAHVTLNVNNKLMSQVENVKAGPRSLCRVHTVSSRRLTDA